MTTISASRYPKCLSFHQRMKLREIAAFEAGKGSPRKLFKAPRTTTRALVNRGLIRFDDAQARYVVTVKGRFALFRHGYESDGTWRGSNQPRECR